MCITTITLRKRIYGGSHINCHKYIYIYLIFLKITFNHSPHTRLWSTVRYYFGSQITSKSSFCKEKNNSSSKKRYLRQTILSLAQLLIFLLPITFVELIFHKCFNQSFKIYFALGLLLLLMPYLNHV